MSRRGEACFYTSKRALLPPFRAHNRRFLNAYNTPQEERKVEVLSAKLAELGVDAGALLAASASDEKKTTSADDLT